MNQLLLDTHTFLWWDSAPERLSPTVLAFCRDPSVIMLLSLVSLWEIEIKSGLGKLALPLPLAEIIRDQQERHNLHLLPITPIHIYGLAALPFYHKDPFDRLLIAQARAEGVPLASADGLFTPYAVSIIW